MIQFSPLGAVPENGSLRRQSSLVDLENGSSGPCVIFVERRSSKSESRQQSSTLWVAPITHSNQTVTQRESALRESASIEIGRFIVGVS